MRTVYRITSSSLDLEAVVSEVTDPRAGAVATFMGTTRNSFRGKDVDHLEYDAYGALAEPVFEDIGTEIADRWNVTAIAIVHRVGRVEVGEPSVIVAVSAPHRRDALDACAHGIERLKAELPVWKKEVFSDGAQWCENA